MGGLRGSYSRVLRECARPGATVSSVAHAHGMNTNNIYRWRRQPACSELKLVGG
ncbi:transposase [Castellaniella caeni]